MAYVGNVVAFLKACVDSDRQYGLFNYVDTPDLDEHLGQTGLSHSVEQGLGGATAALLDGSGSGPCCRWGRADYGQDAASQFDPGS